MITSLHLRYAPTGLSRYLCHHIRIPQMTKKSTELRSEVNTWPVLQYHCTSQKCHSFLQCGSTHARTLQNLSMETVINLCLAQFQGFVFLCWCTRVNHNWGCISVYSVLLHMLLCSMYHTQNSHSFFVANSRNDDRTLYCNSQKLVVFRMFTRTSNRLKHVLLINIGHSLFHWSTLHCFMLQTFVKGILYKHLVRTRGTRIPSHQL